MNVVKFIIGIVLALVMYLLGIWTAQQNDAQYLNHCQEVVQDQQDLLDLYHTNINEICAEEFERMTC